MLNCQQVKSICAATQEELQDLINEQLRKLGKRVITIDFISPLCEGYGANIIYWSQDIAATMTCKLDTLPNEPEAQDDSKLFVLVLHDFQREMIESLLISNIERLQEESVNATYNPTEQDDKYRLANQLGRLLPRFEDDEEQLE